MSNRYRNREILENNLEMYKEVFRKRNIKFVRQYESPNFKYPKGQDFNKFEIVSYTWKMGDSYFKLADAYYGDAKSWWVIAKFNNKPTESHVSVGDTIYIPIPLPKVLNYLTG